MCGALLSLDRRLKYRSMYTALPTVYVQHNVVQASGLVVMKLQYYRLTLLSRLFLQIEDNTLHLLIQGKSDRASIGFNAISCIKQNRKITLKVIGMVPDDSLALESPKTAAEIVNERAYQKENKNCRKSLDNISRMQVLLLGCT